tara:strand:+ start:140 stop:901 length:762 start_codon:yes stop_codon:yes gene_type:complete
MTPAVAERREKNSKSGKVFCSHQCGPAYNKEQRVRAQSRLSSLEAQVYLDGYFNSDTDNNRMNKEMRSDHLIKALEIQKENPEMGAEEILELVTAMDETPAGASPIAEAPPVVSVAPSDTSNIGKIPADLLPQQDRSGVSSASTEEALAMCDAQYWDVSKQFPKCAWSPEHRKFAYWIVEITPRTPNEKPRGYIPLVMGGASSANPCYRCNGQGKMTQQSMEGNYKQDKRVGDTTANTMEEYVLQKRLDFPLV